MPAIKIFFIGDKEVGQSALIKRLAGEPFDNNSRRTVAGNFTNITAQDKKLMLWDLPGEQKFLNFAKSALESAQYVVLVYEQNNIATLRSLKEWVARARETNPDKVPQFILVGTKGDLPATEQSVQSQTLQAFQNESDLGDIPHFQTSAKTGDGIFELKQHLLQIPTAQPEPMRLPVMPKNFVLTAEDISKIREKIEGYILSIQHLYQCNPDHESWAKSTLKQNLDTMLELFNKKVLKTWSEREKDSWTETCSALQENYQSYFKDAQDANCQRTGQIFMSIALSIGAILLSCTLIGLIVTVPQFIKNYQETSGNPLRFHRTPEERAMGILRKIDEELKTIGLNLNPSQSTTPGA